MQHSVTQTATAVKPIVIDASNLTPFMWGIEDGQAGRSLYAGYSLFCGAKFLQYKAGWNLGQRRQQRKAVRP